MAFIDAVPGVRVYICIDGKPVPEYDDADETIDGPLALKTAVKYIEAISDTEFAIKLNILPAFKGNKKKKYDIRFRAKVDGKWKAGCSRRYTKATASASWNGLIEGVHGKDATGRSTMNAFKFAAIGIGWFAGYA